MHDSVETAAPEPQGVLYRSPRLYGLERSRWWLDGIRRVVPWLTKGSKPISLAGLCKLLKRLAVSYKRGRRHVHSPDLDYDKKLAVIEQAKARTRADPLHHPLLYEDEHSFWRHPPPAAGYASCGGSALKARQGQGYNTMRRIAACLDITTGAVIERQRGSFNVTEMARFLLYVERHYPEAETITIVLDNWPVHFHPYVLDELEKHHSRIQLLRLPTYAPWTNPTEKVWRKLMQEVISLHPFSDDWVGLKQAITDWFEPLHAGSEALLHYVGLRPQPKPPRKRCPD